MQFIWGSGRSRGVKKRAAGGAIGRKEGRTTGGRKVREISRRDRARLESNVVLEIEIYRCLT